MANLSIDLAAITANYNTLKSRVGERCEVSSVVKANAYGLGISRVANALHAAGCKTFFVATLPEALELRMLLGDASTIAMLNGFDENDADLYVRNTITPILNDADELAAYTSFAKHQNITPPAIAHIDTGMNRLGMRADDLTADSFDGLTMRAIMSHFASADDKDSEQNAAQHRAFDKITKQFPNIPKSLSNSSGIYLHDSYHYDLVRPGMALYGLNPTLYTSNPMQSVVTINAKILQTRAVKKDETVGYNETYRFDKNSRLAIIDLGYADGLLRSASNTANLYWKNIPCPVRGNVSMDLTIVDLTNIPENQMPQKGDTLELIGPNQSADDLARAAGTIGYKVLTSLGNRYAREYKGA